MHRLARVLPSACAARGTPGRISIKFHFRSAALIFNAMRGPIFLALLSLLILGRLLAGAFLEGSKICGGNETRQV